MSVDKYRSVFQSARFRPGQWLLMRPQDQTVSFSLYGDDGWQAIDASALPEPSRFSRHILLLPDQQCVFRNRSFPLDLLASGDLEEAVVLDMECWNPFHEPCDHLYFAGREKNRWSVAVWVWPKSLTSEYLAMLPEKLVCTHVMPELAWLSACLRCTVPALLIQTSAQHQLYTLVSTAGVPLSMAEVSGEAEARRYCRSVCSHVEETAVFVDAETQPFWLADKAQKLAGGLPRAELLARARLPGVMDWTDPVAWKRPIAALAVTALVWLMGDAAVLSMRGQSIEAELSAARAAASQVLDERDRVDAMRESLLQIQSFQRQQVRPELLLAHLGDAIPGDIWIHNIQLKDQWVDLSGQGKDVARLTVLLESVSGVRQVVFTGPIQPDARTGLETFNVRLMLADRDGA